jgi:hypothetical protein
LRVSLGIAEKQRHIRLLLLLLLATAQTENKYNYS